MFCVSGLLAADHGCDSDEIVPAERSSVARVVRRSAGAPARRRAAAISVAISASISASVSACVSNSIAMLIAGHRATARGPASQRCAHATPRRAAYKPCAPTDRSRARRVRRAAVTSALPRPKPPELRGVRRSRRRRRVYSARMVMPRTVLVVNPRSQGGRLGKRWKDVADTIGRAFPFDELITQGPHDATRLTREALRGGAERVV